ncbi:ATP-binding cassette, subfamily B [Nonomuraea solani]|uniref:ATP-binding cassette, subfamily B n=2 Tax=Nonomuraea solani TaxID=1144553 RepID=A0A1H6F267_9ACTN|nr:ATP-binding cassette, subfamily B [Nonomuraea solani]
MDATLGTRFEDSRLSALADRSVRLAGLDPGDLVDGTHDDLIRRGGPYAEMYRLQASSYR